MSFGWVMIAVLVVVSYAQRVVGMVLLRREPRSRSLRMGLALLPVAVLSAVVATQTLVSGRSYVLDARAPALAAASVAAYFKAPLPAVCIIAAVVAAGVRGLGLLP